VRTPAAARSFTAWSVPLSPPPAVQLPDWAPSVTSATKLSRDLSVKAGSVFACNIAVSMFVTHGPAG
jgi:hypothetical protein